MNKNCLKTVWLFLAGFLFSTLTFAQQLTVNGRVVNDADGKAVEGVSVVVRETGAGTQTNAAGEFTISARTGQNLTISYTGYTAQTVRITGPDMTIRLRAIDTRLDEVVVTGYSTQRKRDFTGASTQVKSEDLRFTPATSASSVLQGTVPGIMAQNTTGQPGSTLTMSFRGGSNFGGGGGSPLVIVDGIPVSSLYGISPNDIETMDLLKDAASLAIYGARAANGVLIVTTKKGKRGRSVVEYGVKYTNNRYVSTAKDYLTAAEYIHMNRQGLRSRYLADSLTNQNLTADKGQLTGNWGWANAAAFTSPVGLYTTQIVTNANRQLLNAPGWQLLVDPNPFYPQQMDSILYRENSALQREQQILRNTRSIEHNLNFSGANDKGAFSLGLVTLNDVGTVVGSSLKHLSVNFNGSLNVNKNLRIGLNTSAYSDKPFYPYSDPGQALVTGANGGLIQRFIGAAPTVRYTNDTSGAILPGPNDITLGNPDYWSNIYKNKFDEQRFSGSVNLEWTIVPNLKFISNTGGWLRYGTSNYFTTSYQAGNGGSFNTSRSASFNTSKTHSYTLNGFLKYDYTSSRHRVSVMGGGEYYELKGWGYSGYGQGAPTDLIPWLSATTSPSVVNGVITNPSGASSSPNSWERIASLIGDVNYTYNDKYILRGILRYDGSSKLYGNNIYILYPGISAGWNMDKESFFINSGVKNYISSFKPRASYGFNGNTNLLGSFSTDLLFSNAGVYNGQGGLYVGSLVNPELKWESVSSLNLGADIGFLNNRITLIGDYFIRNVYDKLANMPISAQTGFTSQLVNLSRLQVKGLELDLEGKILTPQLHNGISLTARATFFTAKSYVKKLPVNGLAGNRIGGLEVWDPANPGKTKFVGALVEGQRDGSDEVWAPQWNGIYTTQAMIDADANVINRFLPYTGQQKFKQLGDARWTQVYKNDTIDSRQFVFVGRTTPKATGSFALTGGFKGLIVRTKMDYAYGFVIMNNSRLRGLSQVQGSQNGTKDILNTWTPDNPNATLPRFYWANQGRNYATDASGNNVPANMWEKGDYLMLREVTLGYDIPATLLGRGTKNMVKGLTVYVTGSNLKYFKSYSGTFPEVGGTDVGRYALPKRITLGANVTL